MESSVYDEVWNSFINGDHISKGSIWGGEGYALLLPITQPDVIQKIVQLQRKFGDHLPFEPLPADTLHVTIKLFGELAPEKAESFSLDLQNALSQNPQFHIDLFQVNSFFRSPFIEVHDKGELASIVQVLVTRLVGDEFSRVDYGQRGQIFHCTLGAYTQAGDGAAARHLLKTVRTFKAGSIFVKELAFVRTSAGKPYRWIEIAKIPLHAVDNGWLPRQ